MDRTEDLIKQFEVELQGNIANTVNEDGRKKIQQAVDDIKYKYAWLKERKIITDLSLNHFDQIEFLYNENLPAFRKVAGQINKNKKAQEFDDVYNKAMEFLGGSLTQPDTPKSNAATTTATPTLLTISEVSDEFCEEQLSGGSWSDKTHAEYRVTFRLLENILGDKPLNAVDFEDMRTFKKSLRKLPKNYNKKAEHKSKTLLEILELGGGEVISTTTVNKHLQKVSTLLAWAKRHGYCSENFAEGLSIRQKTAADKQRNRFSTEDLIRIFNHPVYSEYKFKHAYYFWLPLLGLFTGARIQELCQLHLKDIKQEEDIWVFSLIIDEGDQDKRLKNVNSERLIPIHQTLIDIGFLTYYKRRVRHKDKRLFPELRNSDREGYSQAASKWFARFKKTLGFETDGKKAFHSFRHTLADNMKQRCVDESITAAIIGHKHESITYGRYGKDYSVKLLKEEIDKIEYEGLDLSHLKWRAK